MGLICSIILSKLKLAKGSLLLSFLCFSSIITVNSQETKFGIKAGFNYSSILGDLTEGFKFRFSGHGGVFIVSRVNDKFALQLELLYSSQGFQFSSDLESIENNGITLDQNDFRTNVQLNYLTIPVIGKFALNNRLDLEFGPQFGFLLNQVTKTKLLDQNNSTPDDRNSVSGDFQLDYGVVAGIDFKINDKISMAPRFYIGLRNRLNGLAGNLQNYNAAVQLSVAYSAF